jgi:tRNA pseudouridine38-40 synthase
MNTISGSVPPNSRGGPAVRIRLDISYDGTDFAGWAVQPAQRTVAGVLGDALATLFRVPVSLVVAGRTDAGVHAIGQVAHIDVDPARLATLTPRRRNGDNDDHTPLTGLSRRLAGMLPTDVRVRGATAAPDGFDARFSALRRHYRYRISTAAWGVEPIVRAGVLAHQRPLDVEAMSRAAATLLGLQDFATFCKARPGATTIRELQQLAVSAIDDDVLVQVTADAFCHSMVRSLVGALIDVGEGRLPVAEPAAMLSARQRTSAVHTAPACGLTLVGVDYPPAAELAERAAATRTLRSRPDEGDSTDNGEERRR